MRIPDYAQVFPNPVVISDKDVERLSPHLSGWMSLHEIMLLGINESDLQRLVVLELLGKKRKDILQRLTARIASTRLAEMKRRIALCLRAAKVL
jgi:hypothetical protein